MTFSYLRAYANTKKSSLFSSYIISGAVYASLITCLLLPTTPLLLTLQLFLVYLQLVWSLILFIGGSVSESLLIKNMKLKKYSGLIGFIQVYNFRDKYATISSIHTLIGVALVVANMLVLGWIWQPIVFLLFTGIGSVNAYNTIDRLPEIVSKFDIKEEDFV